MSDDLFTLSDPNQSSNIHLDVDLDTLDKSELLTLEFRKGLSCPV